MAISAEVKVEIAKLINDAKSGNKLVSSVAGIIDLLEKHQLAWRQRIHASQVGVHPHNSDGVGVSVSETHSLIDDILAVGFSKEEAGKSVCIEVGPTDGHIKDFNQRLTATSNGKLGSLQMTMRYASVAGSHLNAGINCWLQGLPHDGKVGTSNGCLSQAMLKEQDLLYWDACEHGLQWLVISSQVPPEFPELPHLLQSSMNVASHLSRAESELQLLRKIWAAVIAQMGQGKSTITWNDVKTSVLRSKPTLAMTCPMMFGFVLKFSGGVSGHLMEETESFIRAHGHARRSLGPDVYAALSQDLKGTEQYAKYRHCALILILSCIYSFVQWDMQICLIVDGT